MFRLTKNSRLVEDLSNDFTQSVETTAAERAMLEYAARLTRSIEAVCQEDVVRLREHQFSDRAILEINQIAGYFAFVNRLASGLGVELEDFWQHERTVASPSKP